MKAILLCLFYIFVIISDIILDSVRLNQSSCLIIGVVLIDEFVFDPNMCFGLPLPLFR